MRRRNFNVFLTYFNAAGKVVKTAEVTWELPECNTLAAAVAKVRGLRNCQIELPGGVNCDGEGWDGAILVQLAMTDESQRRLLMPTPERVGVDGDFIKWCEERNL